MRVQLRKGFVYGEAKVLANLHVKAFLRAHVAVLSFISLQIC